MKLLMVYITIGSFFIMLDQETQELLKSLYKFMKKRFGFSRKPNLKFMYNKENANKKLGLTGHYDPDAEEITIFCYNRHPKDILRSFAHELMHHIQKCEGILDAQNTRTEGDENYIVHDKYLEGIEADAFERGNIAFRFWEAETKMNGHDKLLNQEEVQEEASERKLTDKQLKKAKEMAASMEKKQGYSAKKAHKIAYATVQKESVDPESANTRSVDVNEALKDSVVYQKDDRACNDLYNKREEAVFEDLMKKFGIKK